MGAQDITAEADAELLAAARGAVLDTARRLLAERLGIDGSELSSVVRALCDRFDVSRSGALRADAGPPSVPR